MVQLTQRLLTQGLFTQKKLRAWAPVLVLVALCLVVASINQNFLTLSNLIRLLNAAAIPMVLVMGATFVILMGSIDLSVEGVVALTPRWLRQHAGDQRSYRPLPSAFCRFRWRSSSAGSSASPMVWVHVRIAIPSFMATLGLGFACVGIATASPRRLHRAHRRPRLSRPHARSHSSTCPWVCG